MKTKYLSIGNGYDIDSYVKKHSSRLSKDEEILLMSGYEHIRGTYFTYAKANVALIFFKGIIIDDYPYSFSGYVGIGQLLHDVQVAVDNENISRIVLSITSPGGYSHGLFEGCENLAKLNDKKPIHAYVGSLCASAAYVLASSCSTITAHKTAEIGSVGVFVSDQVVTDPNFKEYTIISSNAPLKHPKVGSDEWSKQMQKTVDGLEEFMIDFIAKGRNVTSKYVINNFGQGSVLFSSDAIKFRMIDHVGDLESLLVQLSKGKLSKGKGEKMLVDKDGKDIQLNYSEEGVKMAEPGVLEEKISNETLASGNLTINSVKELMASSIKELEDKFVGDLEARMAATSDKLSNDVKAAMAKIDEAVASLSKKVDEAGELKAKEEARVNDINHLFSMLKGSVGLNKEQEVLQAKCLTDGLSVEETLRQIQLLRQTVNDAINQDGSDNELEDDDLTFVGVVNKFKAEGLSYANAQSKAKNQYPKLYKEYMDNFKSV